jgi:hypothetical protein
MAAQDQELKERTRIGPPTTEEIDELEDAFCFPGLQRTTTQNPNTSIALTDEWIKVINGEAEWLTRIWNANNNKSADEEGLWYQLSHIANELDWTSRPTVAKYSKILNSEFERYVAPIDIQFRIGKLLILLTIIIAENGHEAWQAVFNPYHLKTSLELNALIHDEFVLDSQKPLTSLDG